MDTAINAAIKTLLAALRSESGPNTTTFTLFVNCEGHNVETGERTPEDLKRAGISMRNLKGEFIK